MAESRFETKIVINGDSKGAESALSRVNSALSYVGNYISGITKFLGQLNWAIQAVTAIKAGIEKLGEFIHRAETAARNLREELERANYSTAVAHAAASYEKLNQRLADTVRLEKERNEIIAARKYAERDLEDAQLEQQKQIEISALDPNAKDYDTRKKDIERKYDVMSSDRRAARADEDVRKMAEELYKAADAKDREADAIEKELQKHEAILERAVEAKFKAGMDARGGDDNAVEKAQEAEKAFQEAFDKAKKIREEMENARSEAESIRKKAGETAGGNLSARIMNDANKQRIENEKMSEEAKNAEDAKKKADEKAKADAEKKLALVQKVEDATLERQKQEDIAALDPRSKNYERDKREVERTYEIKALENKRDRSTTAEERQAAQEELNAIGIRHETERRQEDAAKANDIESFLGRAASFDGVSQNRLTAMGLGSGVSAKGDVSSDVRKLVDLMRQQIAATKENRQSGGDNVSVFGE